MSYGRVEINGKWYLEKFHVYPLTLTLLNNQILTNQRVVMQGDADFWLKYLARDWTVPGAGTGFKFRLYNSDGTNYTQAPNAPANAAPFAGTTDRVRDSLLFGNGALPFPVIPHILFSKTGAISFDIEDLASGGQTIDFAFIGSLLFPID